MNIRRLTLTLRLDGGNQGAMDSPEKLLCMALDDIKTAVMTESDSGTYNLIRDEDMNEVGAWWINHTEIEA